MRPVFDRTQAMQRLRVGVTGIALIVLLIVAASALFRSASNEAPVTAIGAPNVDTVANMTGMGNVADAQPKGSGEPLAELGVAPGAGFDNVTATPSATPLPPPER